MDQSIRSHSEPLPQTLDEVMAYLTMVLSLPNVRKVEVTPERIQILRQVREGEAVVPSDMAIEGPADVPTLMRTVDMDQYPFDPQEHPYWCLEGAMRKITDRHMFVTHILAPQGEWLSAWLDLSYIPAQGSRLLGVKVIYSDSDLLDGKVVLLGSINSAGLMTDVINGIVIDLNLP